MKRRAMLLASGACLAAAAAKSFAQTVKPRRIAFVHPGNQEGYRALFDIFRAELKNLGYAEERDISIDVRWGNNQTDRFATLAAETVARRPEVIVTGTSAGVAAFKKATSSIPIVFTSAVDPVGQGFVSSLRRPGGNITGVLLHEDLSQKIVEIAREALPAAHRLAMLVYEADPASKLLQSAFEASARRFGFEPLIVRVAGVDDLDRAFRELAERKADAAMPALLAFFTSNRKQFAERALKARLPLLSGSLQYADSGGLLSYGTLAAESWRRAAALADKILRGAKPAELPVDQPERFYLVVNRKTAKNIGVTLSPVTMLRADRIID